MSSARLKASGYVPPAKRDRNDEPMRARYAHDSQAAAAAAGDSERGGHAASALFDSVGTIASTGLTGSAEATGVGAFYATTNGARGWQNYQQQQQQPQRVVQLQAAGGSLLNLRPPPASSIAGRGVTAPKIRDSSLVTGGGAPSSAAHIKPPSKPPTVLNAGKRPDNGPQTGTAAAASSLGYAPQRPPLQPSYASAAAPWSTAAAAPSSSSKSADGGKMWALPASQGTVTKPASSAAAVAALAPSASAAVSGPKPLNFATRTNSEDAFTSSALASTGISAAPAALLFSQTSSNYDFSETLRRQKIETLARNSEQAKRRFEKSQKDRGSEMDELASLIGSGTFSIDGRSGRSADSGAGAGALSTWSSVVAGSGADVASTTPAGAAAAAKPTLPSFSSGLHTPRVPAAIGPNPPTASVGNNNTKPTASVGVTISSNSALAGLSAPGIALTRRRLDLPPIDAYIGKSGAQPSSSSFGVGSEASAAATTVRQSSLWALAGSLPAQSPPAAAVSTSSSSGAAYASSAAAAAGPAASPAGSTSYSSDALFSIESRGVAERQRMESLLHNMSLQATAAAASAPQVSPEEEARKTERQKLIAAGEEYQRLADKIAEGRLKNLSADEVRRLRDVSFTTLVTH